MKEDKYHHGDLHDALIETGIKLINKNGIENLSLRKVAAECGVSHAAPYSHFKDKEDLLESMKEYATEKFSDALQMSVDENVGKSNYDIVSSIGEAYVGFFIRSPQYYEFIFERADYGIDLDDIETVSSYRPFEIFKSSAIRMFDDMKVPEEKRQMRLIMMWGMVHGIAGIAVMRGVKFSGEWTKITRAILEGKAF